MPDHADLKFHADLLDRMAQAQGVDLQESVICGQVPFEEIADSVLRCAKCSYPGHCEAWLTAHRDGPIGTPQYCRNKELFELGRYGRGH